METMSTHRARYLINDGFATKFVVFVNTCEQDCYSLDVSKENALAMINRVELLNGGVIHAFYNETTGTIAIG